MYSTFPANGLYTLRARATDVAGNQGFATVDFTVLNTSGGALYTFQGFFSPVDNPPVLNQANAGQAIPVKWRLTYTATGAPVSDPNSFVALTSRLVPCGDLDAAGLDVIETYTGNSGLQYQNNGNWQFNWKTLKNYASTCRVMTLTLNDGSTYDADFKFK